MESLAYWIPSNLRYSAPLPHTWNPEYASGSLLYNWTLLASMLSQGLFCSIAREKYVAPMCKATDKLLAYGKIIFWRWMEGGEVDGSVYLFEQ